MKSKNQRLLNDFINYCKANPSERFWQALRNWSRQNFIIACDEFPKVKGLFKDTFYWLDKNN